MVMQHRMLELILKTEDIFNRYMIAKFMRTCFLAIIMLDRVVINANLENILE